MPSPTQDSRLMVPLRRFGLADLLSLVLVLAVAAGLRAGYLTRFCERGQSPGPVRVSDQGDETAALIDAVRDQGRFAARAPLAADEERTAHVAPAFAWSVGHLGKVAPPSRVPELVRWMHAALGAATAALYFFFARRAFRSLAVGLLAGLMAAADPFAVASCAALDDATLASFALAGCLFLCGQAGEKGGAATSLFLGASLGCLGLVRAGFLPFGFVGLAWYLVRSRTLPAAWLCGLLSFLGFLTASAPWAVRNYQAFGEPVPVVTSTHLHLWLGNNPEATGGPMTAELAEKTLSDEAKDDVSAARTQQARYARLGKEAVAEANANPVPTARRRLRAALGFFVGDDWLREGKVAEWTPAEVPQWLERNHQGVLQGWLMALLGLALLGWRWGFAWRKESMPATLAMLWVPLPYVLGHAEGLSGPRLPLDGVLGCFAALALAAMVPTLRGWLLEPEREGV